MPSEQIKADIKKNTYESMSESDRLALCRIARDSVLEPFEGVRGLDTLKKSRAGIEKGLTAFKEKSIKAGNWITNSKLTSQSIEKLNELVNEVKSINGERKTSEIVEKLGKMSDHIQLSTREKYDDVEDRAKHLAISVLKKTFEFVIAEDMDEWILKEAGRILPAGSVTDFTDLRTISFDSRKVLIDGLYPYKSISYKKVIKAFNLSVNVGLGVLVVSNIPGTGLAVSMINMGKTAIKIANRLSTMSAFYGYQITDSEKLFKVSAAILKSLSDWESNEEHIPVSSSIIGELYTDNQGNGEEAFLSLLEEIVKKDAYVAVPGIGMISLGKINLDEVKLDQAIQHLVQNYHNKNTLIQKYGGDPIRELLELLSQVYAKANESDFFSRLRELRESGEVEPTTNWFNQRFRIKKTGGFNLAMESANLDHLVREITGEVLNTPDGNPEEIISSAIDLFWKMPKVPANDAR